MSKNSVTRQTPATGAALVAELVEKGYTPVQVERSLRRSLPFVKANGSEKQFKVYTAAINLARKALPAAEQEA